MLVAELVLDNAWGTLRETGRKSTLEEVGRLDDVIVG
jgi:hypothetical protein